MIIEIDRYTREEIRANPDRLYVFGDNVAGRGRKGQAKECRGEPNAVGIVTKRWPSNEEGAFFTDEDLPKVAWLIRRSFKRLDAHLRKGGDVVWPKAGVGSGLADLERRAPAIAALIASCRERLFRGRK